MKKVVVTTSHRGVFFGDLESRDSNTVVLKNARNCAYWSSSTKGFLGLAEKGPQDGSKVGPSVPRLELFDVTSISDCSESAVEKWENGTWK